MKISTKNGEAMQLLRDEGFTFPPLCNEWKANQDGSTEVMTDESCETEVKQISTRTVEVRFALSGVEDARLQAYKLA